MFYETVHGINGQDYKPEQLAAWAPVVCDLTDWHRSFKGHYAIIAEAADQLISFADMSADGYLDQLYVHPDYQHQGVATALVENITAYGAKLDLETPSVAASLTAQPFFLNHGNHIVRAQQVEREGQTLTNHLMTKQLIKKNQYE